MQTTKNIYYTPHLHKAVAYILQTRTNLRVACAKQHGETLLILTQVCQITCCFKLASCGLNFQETQTLPRMHYTVNG